jgi:hypothetical protein
MTRTLLAISAAYVFMGVLLLSMGLTSRYRWWLKAGAIVITSAFFIEVFYTSKGLLGWPGTGNLPPKFQLLWSRVVEPDNKLGERGAIFLWIEELDGNSVPSGTPRSFRLPYSQRLADRTNKARDEIMNGNPQEGSADDLVEGGDQQQQQAENQQNPQQPQDGGFESRGGPVDLAEIMNQIPHVEFRPMTGPALPPKP